MQKNRSSSTPWAAVIAALVLIVGGTIAVSAGAADPTEGTVSESQPTVAWEGKVYASGGTSVPEERSAEIVCTVPGEDLCDKFDLTVDIDPAHWEKNNGGVEVAISWESEEDDFDLYVYQGPGNTVGASINDAGTSERVFLEKASGEYQVRVVPWEVTDSGYIGGARLESRALVDNGPVPEEPVSGLACTDGFAGPFPCNGIDLEGFLPRTAMGGEANLNDIWGWTDPQTGREYAIVGRTDGTSFVDVTDARAPKFLGNLPSHQNAGGQPVETIFNTWRDMKVYKDHAFIVSEEPTHGMQVFDLTRLRDAKEPQDWTEDAHYSFLRDGIASFIDLDPTRYQNGPDNAHNIALNEESGFAYAIGTSTCGGGGPHMIDVRDPKKPKFAGCVSEDSYTHDNQCVNYRESDPDKEFGGREICFNSNEDTLTIVDVTDKANPEQLARIPYDGATYTHQGWLTEDRRFFLVDDELDEQGGKDKTMTYVFNVEDLRNPTVAAAHAGESESIDHNQYVVGDRTYQANYRSGLRVLDISRVDSGILEEKGFFDVYPPDDVAEFNGAWSTYPYFKSGIVIVSGIEQGLFVLRPSADVTGREPTAEPPVEPTAPTTPGEPETPGTGTGTGDGPGDGPRAEAARSGPPRVANRKAKAGRKGRARFVVKCPRQKKSGNRTIVKKNARCKGKLRVWLKGKPIAQKRFSVKAGKKAVVRPRFRRAAVRSNRGQNRRVTVRIRGKRADGRKVNRKKRVVVRFAG